MISEIQSDLDSMGENALLREEDNFLLRAEAIDFIEFNVLDRIEGLLQKPNPEAGLIDLKRNAENLKKNLEGIDEGLFRRLREEIRMSGSPGMDLQGMLGKYVGHASLETQVPGDAGYDHLDTFLNGLMHFRPIPPESKAREPEMVFYQKTPARIVLEMVGKARLGKEDVFYDLGSGLGQVAILVHLLSGVPAKGIELDAAYCDYARACAADFNLSAVEFIQADAREADYSSGTVFFLYTPFEGRLLQEVLEKLKRESRKGILLFTYGPCTALVSRQGWLQCIEQNGDNGLGIFESR